MNNIVKQVAIFSMVGMMQTGLGASIIEASPLHNDQAPVMQQYDRADHGPSERERFENDRHGREMQRRPHEAERGWHERQRHENERHERELHGMPNHR